MILRALFFGFCHGVRDSQASTKEMLRAYEQKYGSQDNSETRHYNDEFDSSDHNQLGEFSDRGFGGDWALAGGRKRKRKRKQQSKKHFNMQKNETRHDSRLTSASGYVWDLLRHCDDRGDRCWIICDVETGDELQVKTKREAQKTIDFYDSDCRNSDI